MRSGLSPLHHALEWVIRDASRLNQAGLRELWGERGPPKRRTSEAPAIAGPGGRDWPEIGMNLAAACALAAICASGIWALVVVVEALA